MQGRYGEKNSDLSATNRVVFDEHSLNLLKVPNKLLDERSIMMEQTLNEPSFSHQKKQMGMVLMFDLTYNFF